MQRALQQAPALLDPAVPQLQTFSAGHRGRDIRQGAGPVGRRQHGCLQHALHGRFPVDAPQPGAPSLIPGHEHHLSDRARPDVPGMAERRGTNGIDRRAFQCDDRRRSSDDLGGFAREMIQHSERDAKRHRIGQGQLARQEQVLPPGNGPAQCHEVKQQSGLALPFVSNQQDMSRFGRDGRAIADQSSQKLFLAPAEQPFVKPGAQIPVRAFYSGAVRQHEARKPVRHADDEFVARQPAPLDFGIAPQKRQGVRYRAVRCSDGDFMAEAADQNLQQGTISSSARNCSMH